MARRAKFGQNARVAPNYGATIIAMAREMADREDSNLMSAWQNGGTVNGQQVTDEMMLAHWRERLSAVAENDPLYDTYKEKVDQLDYQIHESKQATLYAQHKISDNQMAKFYLDWAKKVVPNSEFYRTLQRDAAQFMNASKARGAAAAKQAAENAYGAHRDSIMKGADSANYIEQVLQNSAVADAVLGVHGLSDTDPAEIEAVFGRLNGPGEAGLVLYNDPLTKKDVTVGEVLAHLKKLDPGFSGNIGDSYYGQIITRRTNAYLQGQKLATSTGHGTDATKLGNAAVGSAQTGVWAGNVSIQDAYNAARATRLVDMGNHVLTPGQQNDSHTAYLATLTDLMNKATDPAEKARLNAEIQGLAEPPNLSENPAGSPTGGLDLTTPGAPAPGDSVASFKDYETNKENLANVAAGKGVFVMGPDSVVAYEPNQQGATGPTVDQNLVALQVTTGPGQTDTIYSQETPVQILVDTGLGQYKGDAGFTYVDTIQNGKSVRMYHYTAGDGSKLWTTDLSSIVDTNKVTFVPGTKDTTAHMTVTAPITADDQTTWKQYGFQPDANGHPRLVDGGATLNATNPSSKSGVDYNTSNALPDIASRMGTPDGVADLTAKLKDPNFLQKLDVEAHVQAGFQYDQNGQLVPGSGNEEAYNVLARTVFAYKENGAFGVPIFKRDELSPTLKSDFTVSPGAPASVAVPVAFGKAHGVPSALLAANIEAPINVFTTGDLRHETGAQLPEDHSGTPSIKLGPQLVVPGMPGPGVVPYRGAGFKPLAPTVTPTVTPTPTAVTPASVVQPISTPISTPVASPVSSAGTRQGPGRRA